MAHGPQGSAHHHRWCCHRVRAAVSSRRDMAYRATANWTHPKTAADCRDAELDDPRQSLELSAPPLDSARTTDVGASNVLAPSATDSHILELRCSSFASLISNRRDELPKPDHQPLGHVRTMSSALPSLHQTVEFVLTHGIASQEKSPAWNHQARPIAQHQGGDNN